MIIAVDAMGGDHAPQSVVSGAALYCRENPGEEVILVGAEDAVRRELKAHKAEALKNIRIHHAASVISMEESPAQSVRRKRDASICVAMDLVKEGRADGGAYRCGRRRGDAEVAASRRN
jgi:phosphate acyltransferase